MTDCSQISPRLTTESFTNSPSQTNSVVPVTLSSPCLAGQMQQCDDNVNKEPGQNLSCSLWKLLEQMKNRERRRFQRMQLPGVVHTMFKLQFDIDVEDIKRCLRYWKHQSSLKSNGLSEVLKENSFSKRRKNGDEALNLSVWDLPSLVRDHMDINAPVESKDGLSRPPLIITVADVLPLSAQELTVLHRKNRIKLHRQFKEAMHTSYTDYRLCMSKLSEPIAPAFVPATPAARASLAAPDVNVA